MKFNNTFIKLSVLLFCIFILPKLHSQRPSFKPASSWLFSPSFFNPAYNGSKDFLTLQFISGTGQEYNNQSISFSGRLPKKNKTYPGSTKYSDFSNLGIGANAYRRSSGLSRTIGFDASVSYHIGISGESLSYISAGASINGILFSKDSIIQEDPEITEVIEDNFGQNISAGLYYYTPSYYVGLSASNFLDDFSLTDSIKAEFTVDRFFFFHGGYKFVLNKEKRFIVEPSISINISDSALTDFKLSINPIIKIYIDDFSLGAFYYNQSELSVFFKYNYPRFYIGAFTSLPVKSPYYIDQPRIEISAGINLSYKKSKNLRPYHW